MPQKYWIVPVPKRGPVDPGYGVEAPVDPGYGVDEPVDPGYDIPQGEHPVQPLPPLVGVWPPPGRPSHPIALPKPGGTPTHPIVIPGNPEHPIALPPGTIWPPLPPDMGITDKTAILVWVSGVGHRWYIYDPSQRPEPKGR